MSSFVQRIAGEKCKVTTSAGDGYRQGTCIANEADLVKALGQPIKLNDDKVTRAWYIATPRGTVALRDYWWNEKNEWSIGTSNSKACAWAVRFLRKLGFVAERGRNR